MINSIEWLLLNQEKLQDKHIRDSVISNDQLSIAPRSAVTAECNERNPNCCYWNDFLIYQEVI